MPGLTAEDANRRERIIIAGRGTPEAAVIGMEDLLRLEDLEDALAAREAVAAYEAGETISLDELEAELEEAASEMTG